jgi:hypothetical protein
MTPLEELQHQVLQQRREITRRQQALERMQQALNIANVSARVLEDINAQQRETDRALIQGLLEDASNMNYIPASLLRSSAPTSLGEPEVNMLEMVRLESMTMYGMGQANAVLPFVCNVVSMHFKLPSIFSTSLMAYLRSRRSANGRLSSQRLQEACLLLSHTSQAKVLFTVLAKGCSILQAEDFIPIIHSIVNLHESLQAACSTPVKLKRYIEFVQVSICQTLSKRRQYSLTFNEFAAGNLIDNFLMMGETTTNDLVSSTFNHSRFASLHEKFTELANNNTVDSESVISAARLSAWCNPTAVNQILIGAVFELRGRRTTANSNATQGLKFADWVWLRLSMDNRGEDLSAIDWFRCLDLDLDGRLCRLDIEVAVRSKCDVLLADDEARLRARCRDSNVAEEETAREIAVLHAKYSVQRTALLADVIAAIPEIAGPHGARRAVSNRSPNQKLKQSETSVGCDMPLLFDLLVTTEKSKRWDGYMNFTGIGRV